MERAAFAERDFRRLAGGPAVEIRYVVLTKEDAQQQPAAKIRLTASDVAREVYLQQAQAIVPC